MPSPCGGVSVSRTVSVVVPIHDRAERVTGAVESVHAQTTEDWELILVDDGSTDGSGAVVDEHAAADERVRAIHHETNRGISAARNTGIDAATGEYVCALDSDDRWRPRKLERQLARMAQLGDDYCGCYTAGVTYDANGEIREHVRTAAEGDLWPDILVDHDFRPHSSHMVRRACLDEVGGYDEAFPRGVDWEIAIRLARRWKVAYVDRVLVERQFADDNVSGGSTIGNPTYQVDIRERLAGKFADAFERHPDVARRFDARLAKHRGLAALDRGERLAAARRLGWATRLEPTASHAVMTLLALGGQRAYRVGWRLKNAVVS